jgi:MraZ protein
MPQRFVGRHERQVDEKGRLALPPKYRARFGTVCFLAKGPNGCIDVMTEDRWDEVAERLLAKVERNEMTYARFRSISGSVAEATLDAQGRVLITPELREYAAIGLKDAVILNGAIDRIEIWNPDRFGQQLAEGDSELMGEGGVLSYAVTERSPTD